MDLANLDFDRLKDDVSDALADGIADLVDGAKADIKKFAADISKDLLKAQLAGDSETVDQLLAQLKVVAEINRVRVENHAWIVLEKVIRSVIKAAASGALSVIL